MPRYLSYPLHESSNVRRRHQPSQVSFMQHVRNRTDLRRDDRQACEHSLNEDTGKPFPEGGDHKNVRKIVDPGDAVHATQEMNAILKTQHANFIEKFRFPGSGARHKQTERREILLQQGSGLQQN